MRRGRVLAAVAGAGIGILALGGMAAQPATPDRSAWRWYKGNTHAHTLESDGDSTP